MAPIKSTIGRSVGKLLNTFRDRDLSLNSSVRTDRFIPPLTATGGSKIPNGSYVYHVFTVDTPAPQANFVVSSGTGFIELLVVGGGGGIQNDNGGGGGGGGIAYASALPISPGTYNIAVGSGGSPNPSNSNAPSRGSDTTFAHPVGTITGLGGAGPASQTTAPSYSLILPSASYPGGSGSGGRTTYNVSPSNVAGNTGAQPSQPTFGGLVTNYGGNGGDTPAPGFFTGAGGGGAGGNGQPWPAGGAGGPGQPFINFPAPIIAPGIPAPQQPNFIPAVGPTGLFGGGGGGASENIAPTTTGGAGGPGGGGTGSNSAGLQTPGVYGTGGGAGSAPSAGTSGGSGIVLIRYLP